MYLITLILLRVTVCTTILNKSWERGGSSPLSTPSYHYGQMNGWIDR